LNQILYAAAQLFCERGYDKTSMNDISAAIGVTKAAIYHFVPGGKRDLLFAIANYGMDTIEEAVITPALEIEDAEQRLRSIIANHALLVLGGSSANGFNPVTIVVDEISSLSREQRKKVDQRKSRYMNLVRETLRSLETEGKLLALDVTVVAFSLVGTIIWLAHWYRPEGRLSAQEVASAISTMLLRGILRN
jgi:AcrR family transcriptional regulator